MTQPSLLDLPPREPRKHRRVRETSIQAYAEARERLKGRKAFVLRVLGAYYNAFNAWPTSAELASAEDYERGEWTMFLLYIRRGLSDLCRDGLVESCGSRRCQVTGRTCLVWRVRSR